jgi:hypothetical protein
MSTSVPTLPPSPDAAPRPPRPSAAFADAPGALHKLFREGEDPAAFEDLLGRLFAAVKPAGIVDELWVRDIADLVWEAFRLRRAKTCLIHAANPEGLHKVLSTMVPDYLTVCELVTGWARGDGDMTRRVNKLLADAGLDIEDVAAETFAQRIDQLERMDRMIASAERRRCEFLREIERHRADLAARLRRASEDVLDAEYLDVADGDAPLPQ